MKNKREHKTVNIKPPTKNIKEYEYWYRSTNYHLCISTVVHSVLAQHHVTVLNRLHGESESRPVGKCRINMVGSYRMTKDSENITHALCCTNVHVIYIIYWTGKLPRQLKLYTDQHRRTGSASFTHREQSVLLVNMWEDLCCFYSSCHQWMNHSLSRCILPCSGHMVPKFNQSTMMTHTVCIICPYDEITVIAGTVILCVTFNYQLTRDRKAHT